ncbi:hypothetical protein ABZ782_27090 [Streptomyces asoensis]|uniref:hypothetical protein n=1 Tax=Streptomyces asoensis TaxID=249586 RepID=UPI0033CBE1C6
MTSTTISSLTNRTSALRRWLVLPSADWAVRPADAGGEDHGDAGRELGEPFDETLRDVAHAEGRDHEPDTGVAPRPSPLS